MIRGEGTISRPAVMIVVTTMILLGVLAPLAAHSLGPSDQATAAADSRPRNSALLPAHGDSGAHGIWTNVSPAYSPKSYNAMTYVPELGGMLLFGGSLNANETWRYRSNSNNWTRLSPSSAPPPTVGASVVHDSGAGKVVMFGGVWERTDHSVCPGNETWLYDPMANTWTNVTPRDSPPPRFYAAMGYDSATQRTVLFGGHRPLCGFGIPENHGPRLNDTWTYEEHTNTWRNVTSSIAPAARSHAAFAFDPTSSQAVLFGGIPGEPYQVRYAFDDTWFFDPATNGWQQDDPIDWPRERYGPGMAFVPDVTLLYGGCPLAPAPRCYTDTWSYDFRTHAWTRVSTNPGPTFAPGSAFAYDPDGVIVAFGDSETWEYDLLAVVEPLVVSSFARVVDTAHPQTVSFNVSITGGVPPFAVAWSFGDGASSSDSSPVHDYSKSGECEVAVVVTDATGATATSSRVVSIRGPMTTSALDWIPFAIAAAVATGGCAVGLWWWIRSRRAGRKEP